MNGRPVRSRKLSNSAERQIRERHVRRMKQRRRRRIIFRSSLLVLAVAAVLMSIIFLTPIFNIKSVKYEGNERVSVEALQQQLPDILGENLFKISNNDISRKLSDIAYIEEVQVQKDYFPAEVTVIIKEKIPCATVQTDNGFVIIDVQCGVMEERPDKPEDMPQLTFYHESFDAFKKDEEAMGELKKFFGIASAIDIAGNITAIEVLEYNEINFQYDGKIDVICGSGLDLDQKLRLFKAAVNNPSFTSNAHGTVDLSTPGKAMYNPEVNPGSYKTEDTEPSDEEEKDDKQA